MTKRTILFASVFALGQPLCPTGLMLRNVPAQVYFSPNGGCTSAIENMISSAKQTIFVQAYSFTSAPIAGALKMARNRGVSVMVILDKSQRSERYTAATFLARAGIPTWIDSDHKIAHNKVMILDEEIVITGSFNFSKAAERENAENLLILKDPGLAKLYRNNWEAHLRHSEKVQYTSP